MIDTFTGCKPSSAPKSISAITRLAKPSVSDEFISQPGFGRLLMLKTQPRFSHCRHDFSFSSADETVHIFNCTKIPLKFALNKLSGISNPSHDIATVLCSSAAETFSSSHSEPLKSMETNKNFHFKRFLSYFFHFRMPRCLNKFK